VEREIVSNQLQGDHYFPALNELVVNWRYSDITATREAPDTRFYRYDGGEFSSRVDGNMRSFDDLEDNATELGVDLTMVFYGPMNSIITPKLGYVSSEKERDSEIRRFGFRLQRRNRQQQRATLQAARRDIRPREHYRRRLRHS
jgi:hypothetical protein